LQQLFWAEALFFKQSLGFPMVDQMVGYGTAQQGAE
jgi:hypothetical protein